MDQLLRERFRPIREAIGVMGVLFNRLAPAPDSGCLPCEAAAREEKRERLKKLVFYGVLGGAAAGVALWVSSDGTP